MGFTSKGEIVFTGAKLILAFYFMSEIKSSEYFTAL